MFLIHVIDKTTVLKKASSSRSPTPATRATGMGLLRSVDAVTNRGHTGQVSETLKDRKEANDIHEHKHDYDDELGPGGVYI